MEFEKLVKHLTAASRDSMEKAVALASSRSHFTIEIEHWLHELIISSEPDTKALLSHFEVDEAQLVSDLVQALETHKTGNQGFPKIGPDIARLLFESWILASSEFKSLSVRPSHIWLAMLENLQISLKLNDTSSQFGNINPEDLRSQCVALLESQGDKPDLNIGSKLTKTAALDQFAINMTELARSGKYDKILGRDDEIRQMIDILCRRKQNNPILTGEAGVGKTAVVEGLAARLAANEVPSLLRGVELYSLDMGLLQAGAGVKGEFENRLKNVIKDVQNSPSPIILFIDEAHTLIGAGNQAGGGDAANLLKPALARGELRTIAATTWAEYKKYFETDAALTRRFQVVKVEEPDIEKASVMLRSIAPVLEQHHSITILDEAVRASVELSHRYIAGRQLPDKCVSLLDTACARVNLSLSTTPADIENAEQKIANLGFEIDRLMKDKHSGVCNDEQLASLESQKSMVESELVQLNDQWQSEKAIIDHIGALRKQLETSNAHISQTDHTELTKQLGAARAELRSIQQSNPLIFECVDASVIAEVVADWTGIPVGRMQASDIENMLALESLLEERVIGQNHGIAKIAQTMQTASAKLADPNRPLGVFMLVGPSGVGKTETALALAKQVYGSEQSMTVINMSEFKEEHKVSLLMGSPPGYVGYGEGGVLTEAVRRKPYSVVLLDEMEKAHPGVQDIFYQVFDKGMLRDGEGRDIDFKNTVIIITSNTASEQISQLCEDPDTAPEPDQLLEAISPTLRETYKPAFLGRINIIPYLPLSKDNLGLIANMQLKVIKDRIYDNYKLDLEYSDEFVTLITEQCKESDTGARQVSLYLNNNLMPKIAKTLLPILHSEANYKQLLVTTNDSNELLISLAK